MPPLYNISESLSLSAAVWGDEAAAPAVISNYGDTRLPVCQAESEVIYK